jgi:hypothetical protein
MNMTTKTDTPTVTLEGAALAAAHELHRIAAEEKDLKARKEAAKAVLAALLTTPGTRAVDPITGAPLVTVRAGATRFDPDKARDILEPRILAMITVEMIDTTLAKEVMSPRDYAACCTHSAPSIVAA